jgi:hypothetical protein
MASTQEKILEALSSSLAGTDYVFRPPNYRKGNAVRELADLVWTCNGCVVLMYMQEKEYNERTLDQQVRARRKAISHNLVQAKGGIRAWKKLGQPLTGTNARQSFNIPYSASLDVIAISVVECHDEDATSHLEETERLGVKACVTLPHQALIEIGKIGGGILDIISLVKEVFSASKRGEKHINAIKLIREAHFNAIKLADRELKWMKPAEIENLTLTIIIKLMKMRAPHPNVLSLPYSAYALTDTRGVISEEELKIWGLGAFLNDMPLSDIYEIAYLIRDGISKMGPNHENWFFLETTTLSGYRIGVVLSSTEELAKNDASCIQDFYQSIEKDVDCRGALLMTWIVDLQPNNTLFIYSPITNVIPNQYGKKCPYTKEAVEQLRNVIEE